MNIMTRHLAVTVAALVLAVPVLGQPACPTPEEQQAAQAQHSSSIDEMARAAEHIAREAAKMTSGWSAKTWEASFNAEAGAETNERITKTFKVGANGSLDIAAISGDVMVVEGGGDTITVEAVKSVRSRSADEAKQQLANTSVTMNQSGNRVEVRVNYVGRNNHASVDFHVTAPAGTSVNARSISGDVQVKNIKGEVRLESISGSVSAVATPNLSSIKTVSGDLELAGLAVNDELTVSTISGDLRLRNIKARVVNAESVSGEMSLTDITCDRATVKSVSGDIEYTRPAGQERPLRDEDALGRHPRDDADRRGVRTGGADVQRRGAVRPRGDDACGRQRDGRPGREHKGLRGTHGDGGALLVLGTFSGDVTIAKGAK